MFKKLLVLIALLSVIISLFIWARSRNLPNAKLAQIKEYVHTTKQPVTPSDTFTVMTYNIGYLSGMTNNLPVRAAQSFYNSNKIEPVEWFVATAAGQASDHLPVVMRFKIVDK